MSPARIWFAMDCLFTADPSVAELGNQFGPGGPLTLVHLLGVAKLQDDGGRVRIGWKSLSRAAYLTGPKRAREIVAFAADNGSLELLSADDKVVVARFPDWHVWQPERLMKQARQARYRETQKRRENDADSVSLDDTTETETETETEQLYRTWGGK